MCHIISITCSFIAILKTLQGNFFCFCEVLHKVRVRKTLAHLIEESMRGSAKKDGGFHACSLLGHCEGTSDEQSGKGAMSAQSRGDMLMFRGKTKLP